MIGPTGGRENAGHRRADRREAHPLLSMQRSSEDAEAQPLLRAVLDLHREPRSSRGCSIFDESPHTEVKFAQHR